jgi:hypothetical protein
MKVPNGVPRDIARKAIRKSRMFRGMLQGTMGLEGQGLAKAALRDIYKENRRELVLKYLSHNP